MTPLVLATLALAGFVDAIAGGGGLLTLPALALAGLDPVGAVATNKLASTFGRQSSCPRQAGFCRAFGLSPSVDGGRGMGDKPAN